MADDVTSAGPRGEEPPERLSLLSRVRGHLIDITPLRRSRDFRLLFAGLAVSHFGTDRDAVTKRQQASLLTARAVLDEAEGNHGRAAERSGEAVDAWTECDFPLEHGRCGLGAGGALLRLGRTDEAVARLRAARAAFERLGTAPFIEEIDALIAGVGAPA